MASKLKAFETEYPSNQWFTKTDLAKFENTWGGLPHLVSRGAQKNFAEFTLRVEKGFVPDIGYFQKLVAKAILFRAAERIVSGQEFGGYRANIVTYTLAWIAHHAGGGIDLQKIWAHQGIDQQLTDLITAVCPAVHKLIVNSDGVNVTEWCKQEKCWSRIKGSDLGLSAYWKRVIQQWRDSKVPANGDGNGEAIDRVISLGGAAWLSLARWAKETRSLEDGQRSVASTLARTINSSRRPSARQAAEGEIALAAARKKGFVLCPDHAPGSRDWIGVPLSGCGATPTASESASSWSPTVREEHKRTAVMVAWVWPAASPPADWSGVAARGTAPTCR
jgi:hypothetical protein